MLGWNSKKLSSMDRAKMVRNSGSYAVLLLALGAMVFFGVCSPDSFQNSGPTGSAAKVGGDVISDIEFRRAYIGATERYRAQFAQNFDPAAIQLSRMVLQSLVNNRIASSQADELGINASEAEVEKMLVDIKAFRKEDGTFDAEQFDNYLRSNRYTEASFMREQRREMAVNKFRQFVADTTVVSPKAAELEYRLAETKMMVDYLKFEPSQVKVDVNQAEIAKFLDDAGKAKVKEYYDTHAAEFNKQGQVKARHILVSFKEARNASGDAAKRTKDEAKARAGTVATAAKKPGADFVALAKQYTDEPSGKEKGGDLGYFERETMVKEFSDAAFAMKAGQVSEIVESPFGFHIIKVEDVKPAMNKTLEQATSEIAAQLLQKDKLPQVLEQRAKDVLAALKAGQPVDKMLKQYGVEWKTSGEFTPSSRFITGLGGDDSIRQAALALQKPGQVAPDVVVAGENRFILRLKSIQQPDMAKLTEAKRKELTDGAAYRASYTLVNTLQEKAEKNLKDSNKIWMNNEYLTLDERRPADTAQQ